MGKLPKLGESFFQERAGVNAVAAIVNEIRCIWRETPNPDVGIDGQIEFVGHDGLCTGKLVAAQVKSGPSFLQKSTSEFIRFWPEDKHRKYWREFPIPVLLIVFDPNTKTAYWADARRQLRSPHRGSKDPIQIPWNQTVDSNHRECLFETAGPIDGKVLSIEELVTKISSTHFDDPQFDVGFLDLFALGTTDIGRKLFYSMGMVFDVVETRASANQTEFRIEMDCQDFCGEYIRFLVSQNLIEYDFTDFLIDWEDRQLQPTFLCPLTSRGQLLLHRLAEVAAEDRAPFADTPIELSDETRFKLPQLLGQLAGIRDRIRSSNETQETPHP